jgi:hypothetical protein
MAVTFKKSERVSLDKARIRIVEARDDSGTYAWFYVANIGDRKFRCDGMTSDQILSIALMTREVACDAAAASSASDARVAAMNSKYAHLTGGAVAA